MKVRLEKDLQLVITPESYVESVALSAWIEKNRLGLLVEAFFDPTLCSERKTNHYYEHGFCVYCREPEPER